MAQTIPERVDQARNGTHPALVCRLPSGWVVLCDMQFLSGYCILLADPVVSSINDLDREKRAEFSCDMATVGDALLEVTLAYRINYAIAGNSDPYLHAHIIPRYMHEPEALRRGLPWSYPKSEMDSRVFNYERDEPLIRRLNQAISRRL